MTKNIFVGLAVVLGAVGTFLGFSALGHEAKGFGDTQTNSTWFAGGIAWGKLDLQNNTNQIVIPTGANQGYWTNNTGRNVLLDDGEASISGTASSSFKIYVGTTTATSVTDTFNGSAPFWSQFIDGYSVATGTAPDVGSTNSANLLTDNVNSHKSTYASKLLVTPGENVMVAFEGTCKSTSGGGCEEATSTNRGFTNLTVTFYYHSKGSD